MTEIITFITTYDKVISIVIQALAILVATCAAYIAIRNQRISKREKEVEKAVDYNEYVRKDEFNELVKAVDKLFVDMKVDSIANFGDLKNRGSEEFSVINNLLLDLEVLAIKVNNQVYDAEVIYRANALWLLNNYSRLLPFINKVHSWYPGCYGNYVRMMKSWQKRIGKDIPKLIAGKI
jgi:hypothetical protein